MAFVTTDPTLEPRAFSIGPLKMQILNYTSVSGDASGTVTADRLTNLEFIIVDGILQTAAPTITGNSAALTFTAVGTGGAAGVVLCFGT